MLDENSRHYTAFSTPTNHYQFRTLSFGLKNSGIAFQKNMQQILSEYSFKNVIVYIDDILIMSETFQEHLQLVQQVLNTLGDSGIKIKVSKCEFFQTEISFLGYIVNSKSITKSPEYTEKVVNYPKPQTVTELRQCLGLVNFQRKFVDQCSVIAKPLTELTGEPKRRKLEWSEEMDKAFEQLKERIAREVTLAYPDYSKEAGMLELFVDASGVGAGGCLVQRQGEEYRTIAYSSMTFTAAQRNYSTIERELLAIRWGIKAFRSFLFGVTFILYSDHKPLLFLHNMSTEKSRLARTLSDLAEYDFIIKHRPGGENLAADTMSRIVNVPSEEKYKEWVNCNELPAGLRVLKKVEGGGNSLFESLFLCLENSTDSGLTNHSELRELLVGEVIENAEKYYNMKMDKDTKKLLHSMKNDGQLPCEAILLAACRVFSIEIWVYHGMKYPVVYTLDNGKSREKVCLQCVSGIHFNPLYGKCKDPAVVSLLQKNVNIVRCEEGKEKVEEWLVEDMTYMNIKTKECSHDICDIGCVATIGQVKFCAMVDSGAEVSVLSESVCRRLQEQDNSIEIEECDCNVIRGINGEETVVIGMVKLKLEMMERELEELPLAVMPDVVMPCCAILGANFLVMNRAVLSCSGREMIIENEGTELHYPLGVRNHSNKEESITELVLGSICVASSAEEDGDVTIRWIINRDRIEELQNRDHALRKLKGRVGKGVAPGNWKESYLQQFRRYGCDMRIRKGIIVMGEKEVPVVPFLLLVEVMYKVHVTLAHIGRSKLLAIVSEHVWHPALDRVSRDITSSCFYCQQYKIAAQKVQPPTLNPFDSIAMDLLQFPRSRRGNIAALVVVDHCSKFVFSIPIKDKTSKSVVGALRSQVFPHLVRLPDRVLTDNGPEFRAEEFNDLLRSFNIEHVYSTRYRAAGNGRVERVNRTITQLLKPLVRDSHESWDVKLPQAVIIYNNTHHSQIEATPAQFILEKAHKVDSSLPLNSDIVHI